MIYRNQQYYCNEYAGFKTFNVYQLFYITFMILVFVAVPAKKILGAIQFFFNFIDDFPNYNPVALHGYKKKFTSKFRVKIKRKVFSLNLSLISRY